MFAVIFIMPKGSLKIISKALGSKRRYTTKEVYSDSYSV